MADREDTDDDMDEDDSQEEEGTEEEEEENWEEEDEEEEEIEIVNDDDDDDDSENSDGDSFLEEAVPTPEEVDLEYTYPHDFVGRRSWEEVVAAGQYFRLILDPSCTEIERAYFSDCYFLIELIFRGTKLTRIRQRAFYSCINLQRITNGLPMGLVELEGDAFFNCGSLQQETLTIPRTVRTIGADCFNFCICITRVVFEHHLPTDTITLHPSVFTNCKELQSVTLPSTLSYIPICCFSGCRSLTNIPIPTAVRVIHRWAFYFCSALRTVDLAENITTIHKEAYVGCTSLEMVTIQSTTVHFAERPFDRCPALRIVNIYPWVWPRLLEAMRYDCTFCYTFVRQYHYQLERFRQR